VVLLYSGGIDSTAAGVVLKTKGYKIFPLFIDYGQSALEAEKHLTKSSLLGRKAGNDSEAWVPGRNTLFKDLINLLKKKNLLQYTVSCWNAKIKKNKVIVCGECANCLERISLNG